MENDVGIELNKFDTEPVMVPHIGVRRIDYLVDCCELKEAWRRRRLQRIATHMCTEPREPQSKPAALESRVACHEDPSTAPKVPVHVCDVLGRATSSRSLSMTGT